MTPRRLLGLALAGGLALLPGCGQSGSSATPGSGTARGNAAAAEEQTAERLAQLTQLVRKFAAEQRQVPAGLDELVARGYLDRIPAAPRGKRYAINQRLEVFLADP